MSVNISFEKLGTFKKKSDKTAIVDAPPARLNDDGRLYGHLEKQLDLNLGGEDFKEAGGDDNFISVFDYLRKKYPSETSLKEIIGADFFTNRHVLTHLAATADPFHMRRVRQIKARAVLKNGVIFLNRVTDNENEWRDYPCGYKFEQYMTLNEDGIAHKEDEKVSNAECTKIVLRTTMRSENENIKLFYAPEVDAIDKFGNLIELKTTKAGRFEWYKKWCLIPYLQSFLGNVPFIILGRKTQDEMVHRVDKIWTEKIPDNINISSWKKDDCLDRLFEILQETKSKLYAENDTLLITVTADEIFYEEDDVSNVDFLNGIDLDHFQ